MKSLLPIFAVLFCGCARQQIPAAPPSSQSEARFAGLVARVYIEDGAGGQILFTPYGDGPPMPKVYAYKGVEYVHLSIVGDWATIYVPDHRTRYVVRADRIIRYDLILSKEENPAFSESVSRDPGRALEPMAIVTKEQKDEK